MAQKSPLKMRQDLEEAQRRVRLLIGVLRQNHAEHQWGLGEECVRAASQLENILKENQIPQDYKVAVIGRFKAGKSSFVNELLGRRLAGEDTSPETAAITTFQAGPRVVARIKLVDKGTWDGLKDLYERDPTDPEAHRMANWMKFGDREPRGSSSTQTDLFDLKAIEREHVKPGGHILNISLQSASGSDAQRKAENDFRRRIKDYTSGSKPHHCLVESIEIETPSPILGEGVTLVDTPGLDDTERFRVLLTEQAVQNVDAVLFLTKSGAAYGQSEKDFLLSLLRKGTVKQLIFVITQVDQTYDQHVRQARDQDEDAEPISDRIEAERRRIRREIEATLDELEGDADSTSAVRYREQLNAVDIAFTSAANHRDHNRAEPVKFPILPNDPGGMRAVKETLFRTLSTESRLAATKRAIRASTAAVLRDMLAVIDKRRNVVARLKNREVAEQKLATFRAEFEKAGQQFSSVAKSDCSVLRTTLHNKSEIHTLIAENIALQGDEILGSYETDDAGRHWRTRRGGHWGYMFELQTRVANKIFPRVTETLNKQNSDFGDYIEKFRVHVNSLAAEATQTVKRLEIGDELQINTAEVLETFLKTTLESLQEIVEGEENKIVALLEEFVDVHVEERITAAREKVANVWGRGTTIGQSVEVRAFYREVRSILRAALQEHVLKRFEGFSHHLIAQAEALPDRTLSEVQAQIERASADIRAAAEAAIAGQRDAFNRIASDVIKEIGEAQSSVTALLSDDPEAVRAPEPQALEADREAPAAPKANVINQQTATPALLQAQAVTALRRFTLVNHEKGWSFAKIFDATYLRGATEAWLVDPYLSKPHQRRNLTEFAMHLANTAKLKTLRIITKEMPDDDIGGAKTKRYFDSLDQSAFEKCGMRIQYGLDEEIHDRSFTVNNGILFKLGRGLDIYKPAVGLSTRDPTLRQVRACEIDVFAPEGLSHEFA